MIGKLLLAALLCPLAAHATSYTATTTGAWNSATTWGGAGVPGVGDTAACSVAITITVSASTSVGTSPASGNVITQSGSCIIALAQNVSLTVLGGWSKLGTVQRAAGSSIVFDSTGAGSPTSTPYTLDDNGTWTDDGTHPPLNTVGNFFTITANSSGTNWRWSNHTAGSGINMTNALIQFCGDPAGAAVCLPYIGGGTGSLAIGMTGAPPTPPSGPAPVTAPTCTNCAPVIFDHTCGIKWGTGSAGGGGLLTTDAINLDISFKNSYASCPPLLAATSNTLTGGTIRALTNTVFDLAPTFEIPLATVYSTIFFKSYTAGVNPGALCQMSYIWIRNPTNNGTQEGQCNFLNSTITSDTLLTYSAGVPVNPTPTYSGTVTGVSANSFTDSTASIPTSAVDDGVNNGWSTSISTGANAGNVSVNHTVTGSGTTVNMFLPWHVTPSIGDHYALYNSVPNCHVTNITANASPITFDGTIMWCNTGDFNGDCFHSANSAATYNFFRTIIGYSPSRGNNCTLGTLGGQSGTLYFIKNSTYVVAQQGLSLCEGCSSSFVNTNVVAQFMDNIAIQEAGVNYASGLGFMVDDSDGTPISGEPVDEIKRNCGVSGTAPCGDYNWTFNLPGSNTSATTGYCSTIHGGSLLYNLNCTGPLGPNDITGDPGFLNPFASPLTWTQSLGVDAAQGDAFQIYGDTMKNLMCINDPTPNSCVPGFTPLAFWNYMQRSFTFTNAIGHGTGSGLAGPDGSNMGAGPFQPPVVTNFIAGGKFQCGGSCVLQ